MSDSYKAVIEIIAGGMFDANKIAILLAKENPELFLQLNMKAPESHVQSLTQYEYAKDAFIRSGHRQIFAIKDVRLKFTLSLMEAKHLVDQVRSDMGLLPPV